MGKQKRKPKQSKRSQDLARRLGKDVVLPKGHSDSWGEESWLEFESQLEGLSVDEETAAWAKLFERDDAVIAELEGQMTEDTEAKSIHDMDEAEFAAIDGYLSAYTYSGDSDMPAKALPSGKVACECDGPPDGKWSNHLVMCPMHVEYGKYKYSGKTTPITPAKPRCVHERQRFDLQDGLVIWASASRDVSWYGLKEGDVPPSIPDYGIYMDSVWENKVMPSTGWNEPRTTPGFEVPWLHPEEDVISVRYPAAFLNWPDHGRPSTPVEDFADLSAWVFKHLAAGKSIDVGCIGGHGRTGTMLACLLAAQGLDPLSAMNRVWEEYCVDAIESLQQTAYVVEVYEAAYDQEWREGSRKAWSETMHRMFKPPAPKHQSSASVWDKVKKAWTPVPDKKIEVAPNLFELD